MNRRELRRSLRAQKKALRAQLAQAQRQARAQVAQNPQVRRARQKRRLKQAAGLAALLLLLLLVRCDCEGPPKVTTPEPQAPDAGEVVVKAPPPVQKPSKPPKLRGDLRGQPRARFDHEGKAPPTWLEEFRIQVAARSPRLSECFNGQGRPGALRWTCALNVTSGAVSDHALESVGGADDLDAKQRACVVKALSDPPYRISKDAQPDALSNRVSLVIEF